MSKIENREIQLASRPNAVGAFTSRKPAPVAAQSFWLQKISTGAKTE